MNSFSLLLCMTGALGVLTIATLAYLASGRREATRFALVVSLLLLAAFFALLPLSTLRADRVSTVTQCETGRAGTWCL